MPDLIMTHLQFFLERELCKPERINRERWLTPPQQALFRLANLMKDPSIGLRNPFSQDSFSMVTVEGRAYWESFMKDIRQEQTRAFYPLNHTGKPFRKSVGRLVMAWDCISSSTTCTDSPTDEHHFCTPLLEAAVNLSSLYRPRTQFRSQVGQR